MFGLAGSSGYPGAWLSALCFVLLLGGSLNVSRAQGGGGVDMTGTGGKHIIQGRIYFPSGQRADSQIKVRLESLRYGEIFVLADPNGSFSFRSLLPGSYTVVVEGGQDYETTRESVFIDTEAVDTRSGIVLPSSPRSYRLQIYLQPKRTSAASTKPGVINAALAAVPEPARGLYQKAMATVQAGDGKKAIAQLKEALTYYPEFSLALNELGVQYLKIGEAGKAAEALRSAVRLAPEAFSPRLNYGIALLEKKDFAEAEEQLRQALKKNDNSAPAHLYLGISLIQQRRHDEAEKELQRAATIGGDQMALARYYLGGLYWRKKEYKLAADELEMYLRLSPGAQNAEKIRATVKDLRSQE
ncbi:MAG TPA: tetratricopeptide repeat protein [Pyrinomonadaceae bacterium]|jgi:tetratricopeptide (TPR) repeat protein